MARGALCLVVAFGTLLSCCNAQRRIYSHQGSSPYGIVRLQNVLTDNVYVAMKVQTGPANFTGPGCNRTIRLDLSFSPLGNQYRTTLRRLPDPGEFSTTIYKFETENPLNKTIALTNLTFHTDQDDDWLLWAFNVTLIQGKAPFDNFNCSVIYEDDDGEVCECSYGYNGDYCDVATPTFQPTSAPVTRVQYSDAQLEPDGFTAKIVFSSAQFPSGDGPLVCSEWLIMPSLSAIGHAVCSAPDAFTLQIELGFNATIQLFDNVTLSSKFSGIPFEGQGFPRLIPPNPIPIPFLNIIGSESVGSCESIRLQAAHTNSLNRPLVYDWTVSTPSLPEEVVQIAADATDVLVINSSLIAALAPTSWTIKLNVTNWMGGMSNTVTKTVDQVSGLAAPSITFFKPDTVSYVTDTFVNTFVTFEACGYPYVLRYSWRQTNELPRIVAISNPTSQNLHIPAYELNPAQYCFSLNATAVVLSDPVQVLTADDSVCFTSLRPMVVAAIQGGDRTVQGGATSIISFNGSSSHDPLGEPLSYSWTTSCVSLEGLTTIASSFSFSANLNVGTTCYVNLTVSAPLSTDVASVLVTAVANEQIPVSIIVNSPFQRSEDGRTFIVPSQTDLSLSALVEGLTEFTTFSWSDSTQNINPSNSENILTPVNTQHLVIRNEKLVPNRTYVLGVSVCELACGVGSKSGYASIRIVVNIPPTGGTCDASPRAGVVLDTPFVLQCSGWGIGLTYLFTMDYDDFDVVIRESGSGTLRLPTLPIGPKDQFGLSAKVTIFDPFRDSATVYLNLTVRPLSVIEDGAAGFEGLVQQRVASSIQTNLSAAVRAINWPDSVCLLTSEQSLFEYSSGVIDLRESAFLQLEALHAATTIDAVTVLQASQMSGVIINDETALSDTVEIQGADLVDTIIQQAALIHDAPVPIEIVTASRISIELAKGLIRALQSITAGFVSAAADVATARNSDVAAVRNSGIAVLRTAADRAVFAIQLFGVIQNVTTTVGRGVISGHVGGQEAFQITDNRGLTLRAARADRISLSDNVIVPIANGSMTIPASLVSSAALATFDIVSMGNTFNFFYAYNLSLTEGTTNWEFGSHIHVLDVFDSSSLIATPVKYNIAGDTQTKISMTFPITVGTGSAIEGQQRRFRCSFINESTFSWDRSGCTFKEMSGNAVTCECTHLTTFIAGAEDFVNDLDEIEIGNQDVLATAAIDIANFPIILYILLTIYTIYLFGLPFAIHKDSDLFGKQLRRAVKYSKKARRRMAGAKTLKHVKLADNSDDSDVLVGGDDAPKVKSNTNVMDLLRKLRDDCAPFEITKNPELNPKQLMQDQYLQRVKRLSSGMNCDPENKLADIREEARTGHAFRKRLKQRNNGFDVREAHDLRDCPQNCAIDRIYHKNLFSAETVRLDKDQPLNLQQFWKSLKESTPGDNWRAHTPTPSMLDSGDDAAGWRLGDPGFGVFSGSDADSPTSGDRAKNDGPPKRYRYFSDDEEDYYGRQRDGGTYPGEDRRYSAFSDGEGGQYRRSRGTRGEESGARRLSYFSQNSEDTGTHKEATDFAEDDIERRYSFFSQNSKSISQQQRQLSVFEVDEAEGKHRGTSDDRRYSTFSNSAPGGITSPQSAPAAVDIDRVATPDTAGTDDNSNVSFTIPDAAERRQKTASLVPPSAVGVVDINRSSSPVDDALLRRRRKRPTVVRPEEDPDDGDDESSNFDFIQMPEDDGRDEHREHVRMTNDGKSQGTVTDVDDDDISIIDPDGEGRPTGTSNPLASPPVDSRGRRLRPTRLSRKSVESDPQSTRSAPIRQWKIQVEPVRDMDSPQYNEGFQGSPAMAQFTSPVVGRSGRRPTQIAQLSNGGMSVQDLGEDEEDPAEGIPQEKSARERSHSWMATKEPKTEKTEKKTWQPILAAISSKEPPHNFVFDRSSFALANEDLDQKHAPDKMTTSNTNTTQWMKSRSNTTEDPGSDSSTDFEKEVPTAWQYYKEALKHYHVWLTFIVRSAFQFSTAERWTVLFCVILGTMAFCSILLWHGIGTHYELIGLIGAFLMLPIHFMFSRMYIHSQNRVDIALGVRKRYSANVRFWARALCAFWMISCGFVILLFGVALERNSIMNVWRLLAISAIADATDLLIGNPLHLALIVKWNSCFPAY